MTGSSTARERTLSRVAANTEPTTEKPTAPSTMMSTIGPGYSNRGTLRKIASSGAHTAAPESTASEARAPRGHGEHETRGRARLAEEDRQPRHRREQERAHGVVLALAIERAAQAD